MNNFKFCYPDANNFSKIIKVYDLKDWKLDYVDLGHKVGYWVGEPPMSREHYEIYKELIRSFPIQKDNTIDSNIDPNPFDTIHCPEWVVTKFTHLLAELYRTVEPTAQISDPQVHEWGNLYFKERSRPITCWLMPHIDYVYGIVGNLWFTDQDTKDSSTRLFRYHGKMYDEIYDFQKDTDHPMHEEWRSMSENPKRQNGWSNMDLKDLERWGFELLGETPNREFTMTIYKSNIPHTPYISENIDFRWSHCYAFSHDVYPQISLKDLFK